MIYEMRCDSSRLLTSLAEQNGALVISIHCEQRRITGNLVRKRNEGE